MSLYCGACERHLNPGSFTQNQRRKGRAGRCQECVASGNALGGGSLPATRTNGFAYGGGFYFSEDVFDQPFAEGAFRFVALGLYVGGPRSRTRCVAKWFKDDNEELEDEFFEKDVEA
jgi:hypothetical protein